ncbi:hypothetical protein AX17_006139 [Amanita inopinata Kibby_2008]|nr:hypothetical protein AX17_006139 [Amanita inopinata Kibby_2008]
MVTSSERPSNTPPKSPAGEVVPASSNSDPSQAQRPQADQPPSYASYEARQSPFIEPYPTASHQYYYSAAQIQNVYHISPARRFWRAFAMAAAIWFLLSFFVHSVVSVVQYHTHSIGWPEDKDFSIPSDLERVRCVWGDEPANQTLSSDSRMSVFQVPEDFPFHKEVSFELPLDSEDLFFFSHGLRTGGQLEIKNSNEQRNTVKVNVQIKYWRPQSSRMTKVCQFKREKNEHGVGVFTPKHGRPLGYNLTFFVTIELPASSSGDILHIKKLETDMPNFSHEVGELGETTFFKNISLQGQNGRIAIGSLFADRGQLKTTNGHITGHVTTLGPFSASSSNGAVGGVFTAKGSLSLKTSNSPIRAQVFINTGDEASANLEMITTNGYAIIALYYAYQLALTLGLLSPIQSDISLNQPQDQDQERSNGGDFNVIATTSNSPLRLTFPFAPLDSKLTLHAKTRNSPLQVSLHPTYEGGFKVSSTNFRPSVVVKPGIDDPAGEGRERDVRISDQRNQVSGSVSWSGEGKQRGNVDVATTNSPAVLEM